MATPLHLQYGDGVMGTLGKRTPGALFLLLCLIAVWEVTALIRADGREPPSSAPSQGAASDSELRVLDQHRVTTLLGMALVNEDGEELGMVTDFIVDLRAGRTLYAIVTSQGVLGLGAREILVAAPAMTLGTTTERTLAVSLRHERWKNAPVFKKKDLPTLGSPGEVRRIYQFYGQRVNDFVAASTRGSPGESAHPGQASEPNTQPGANSLFLARDMLGVRLLNEQHTKLGTISDLLLDLTDLKPTLALLAANHSLEGEATFAVQLSRLQHTSHKWQLDATAESFRHAAPFNLQAWQAANDPEGPYIFRLPEERARRSGSDDANGQ